MAIYYIDPVLAAAAIIPAVVLLIKVYQADRLEKEPVSLILSLVFFGVLSTAIAMVLEQVGTAVLVTTCLRGALRIMPCCISA